jgi:hypothetical protein
VIYPTLRAAASSDPQVAVAYEQFVLGARYQQHEPLGARMSELGALATPMTAAKATDVLWTVLSPDTYHLLVHHRGWTVAEFEAWATDTLIATLVAKQTRRR